MTLNNNTGKLIAFRVQAKTTQTKLNKFFRDFYIQINRAMTDISTSEKRYIR